MCGLAGVMARGEAASTAVVQSMNEAIAHRGPDDFGVWEDAAAGICLGHRRLSIVDLSAAGHQPMRSASGRYVMVFNGEIYNHLDLRAELEQSQAAPAWRGHSDTETLLAGIDQWGLEATLQRATGMFAIALWDRQTRQLWLARDRLGEKPLYYGWQGAGDSACFLFGSELKALRRHPAFQAPVSRGAVALLLQHNYVPAPWTIHEGIFKLPPGSMLAVSFERRDARPSHYWNFTEVANRAAAHPFQGSPDEAADELERLATTIIGRQMVADVPLGAFLSGGIDSSLVVALMQAQSSRRVRTFTIGFEEAAFNEAVHAKAVAHHLGTDHTELYVTAQQARDVIPQLPGLYCEPFADSSQIPTYLVSRLARRHVTVSLSGDAGDELFGGYHRYGWALERWNRLARVPGLLRSMLATGMGAASRSGLARSLNLRRAMQMERAAPVMGAATLDEIYLHLFSHLREPLRWVKGATPLQTAFDSVPQATSALDPLQRLMALDTVTYLPDDVLTKVDRAAMAASLETRVPFLDHRFVEFAWRLPTHYKVRNGQTKWPLRQVLYRHVPRELIERPKKGFGVPINQWLRGPLRDWADHLLDPRRLESQGLLQAAPITELWRQHREGIADWSLQLWNVLMIQAWLDSRDAAMR